MVKVRQTERDTQSERWLEGLVERFAEPQRALIWRAHEYATEVCGERLHPSGETWTDHTRGAAGIIAGLRLDAEAIASALLLGIQTSSRAARENLQAEFGASVAALVEGVASMAPIQALRVRADLAQRSSDKAAQLEALRKMLLAMVQDARVVLLKLADQLQVLRFLISREDQAARHEAAIDTLELFAPLANRLGVWQLKWELEDLAFRCQEPETYKSIARKLDEKRVDRETYIEAVTGRLSAALANSGVRGQVTGRPKHIYSIWKKLQRKGGGIEELFDVRAVRVLVEDVKDCYAALGVVHSLWSPIPREFDDYIAKPKSNDYRSLHTAVAGPDGRALEVQIRTYEMHQHAELGVAAHWRYKESAPASAAYDRKISWLRSILDWRDELSGAMQLAQSFPNELLEDSVYALTPQGRVIDLPRGATPVDFAYHVHSELGHRCRGAKVNGKMVPLNHRLSNGDVVEIICAKEGGPSRDWLTASLGFLASTRARTKVRQWFNSQAHAEAVAQGRAGLEKELQRLGRTGLRMDALAIGLGRTSTDDLFAGYQRGEISAREVQNLVRGTTQPYSVPAPTVREQSPSHAADGILVVGVDKLLTVLARCCKPVPPDPIAGFVSRGRGVTVHRQSCANLARLPSERLIAAHWGRTLSHQRFAVDVEVIAASHPDLQRNIHDVFARDSVRVQSSRSVTQDLVSRSELTLEVEGLDQLERLLLSVRELPGVTLARRR